jgi:hypothetical protein
VITRGTFALNAVEEFVSAVPQGNITAAIAGSEF